MLSENEKQQLIKRLPRVELSYDKMLHNKVRADIYVIIPKGPKACMWITYIYGKPACFIVEFAHNKGIKNIDVYNMCFDTELAMGSYGTLIYGTLFYINKTAYFSCENLHYFKGDNVTKYTFQFKLQMFKSMFSTHIKQKSLGSKFIIPGLPIYKSTYESALNEIKSLPYMVYGIQHHNLTEVNRTAGIMPVRPCLSLEGNFIVKATVYADIYDLYCYNNGIVFHGNAMIPNYKSSVMLNTLFRNIKENHNLDALEESEDEDEFENTSDDKFVNLDKTAIMKCVYMPRFKKWHPVEVVKDNARVLTSQEASGFEKNQ